jgi:hypothetical protein
MHQSVGWKDITMPSTSPIHLQFFNLLLDRGDLRLLADDCPGLLGGFEGVDNLAYLDSCGLAAGSYGHL